MLKEAAGYIDVIVTGGEVALPLVGSVDILGLRRAQTIIEAAVETLPEDAPERIALTQVARFARLAADNRSASSSRARSSRAWPEANDALSDAVLREAAGYIDVIVTGGEVALPLVGSVDILGLRRSQAIIEAAVRSAPGGRPGARGAHRRSRASPAWPPTTSTSPSRSWPRSARRWTSSRPT